MCGRFAVFGPRRSARMSTGHGLQDLADRLDPVVRGWLNYYGRFTPTALHSLLTRINGYLVRWARKRIGGWSRSNA